VGSHDKDDPDITTDYHRKSTCEWAERFESYGRHLQCSRHFLAFEGLPRRMKLIEVGMRLLPTFTWRHVARTTPFAVGPTFGAGFS
jgi:hypothetical protein